MKKTWIAVALVAVFLVAMLVAPSSAFANSALREYSGSTVGGVASSESCPLVVTHEQLTFNIGKFPELFGEFADYNTNVVANYTFQNTGSESATATLAFPYGAMPYYVGEKFDDMDKCNVTVDGESIETSLRFTFLPWGEKFSITSALPHLRDTEAPNESYSPDTPVYKHVYKVHGYQDAEGELAFSFDSSKSRVEIPYFNRIYNANGTVMLKGAYKDGDEIEFYVAGEDLDLTTIAVFSNVSGFSITETSTEELTFKQYVTANCKSEDPVTLVDYYNVVMDYYSYCVRNQYDSMGMLPDVIVNQNYLMRWCQYKITVAAGATIQNAVTVPIYPDVNEWYSPAVYTFTYLLSPASTWPSFGDIDVEVKTDKYILKSSTAFTKCEGGYKAHFDSLPEGELTFEICESKNPKSTYWGDTFLMILAIILVLIYSVAAFEVFGARILEGIAIAIIAIVFKVKRNKREKQAKQQAEAEAASQATTAETPSEAEPQPEKDDDTSDSQQ